MSEVRRHFSTHLVRHGIDLWEDVPIDHDTFLTRGRVTGFRLSTRYGLQGSRLIEAVCHQLMRIELGHQFQRSGYKPDHRTEWRQWKQARLASARHLLPEPYMEHVERAELTPEQMAEETGYSVELCALRCVSRELARGRVVELSQWVERSERAKMAAFFSP